MFSEQVLTCRWDHCNIVKTAVLLLFALVTGHVGVDRAKKNIRLTLLTAK